MAVYEMTNYARIQHILYKGVDHVFPRNHTQRTEDPGLAEMVDLWPYIEVIEVKKPLGEMTKRELLAEAKEQGLKNVSLLNKAGIVEAIENAVQ